MRKILYISIISIFALSSLGSAQGSVYAKDSKGITKFKAATILKMLKYVDIKDNDERNLCITGNRDIFNILEKFKEEKGLKIFSNLIFVKNTTKLPLCDYIFLSRSDSRILTKSLGYISNFDKPVVTMSDFDNFVKNNGGIIALYEDKGKLRFSLNLKKAKSQDIQINSKLIESADEIF